MQGTWDIPADAGEVRVRTGSSGPLRLDASAPVRSGSLRIGGDIEFTLVLALDQMRTSNFLMQAAARSLITAHRVHELVYVGTGALAEVITVLGTARAGDLVLDLGLRITPIRGAEEAMSAIEIAGDSNVGTVQIPLPGVGQVDDLRFSVAGRLPLRAATDPRR